jgi:hypothetical protein
MAEEEDTMSQDDKPQDDDWLWRDVEQHQARAVKRLDADADDAPLADGYGLPLAPPGADSLADLTRALARDLIAAGFTIHDCAGKAPGGGVCLTPASNKRGVLVTWTQHDAAEAVLRDSHHDIQEEMNCAVANVVTMLGYPIEGYGQAGAHIVTGARRPDELNEPDDGDSDSER